MATRGNSSTTQLPRSPRHRTQSSSGAYSHDYLNPISSGSNELFARHGLAARRNFSAQQGLPAHNRLSRRRSLSVRQSLSARRSFSAKTDLPTRLYSLFGERDLSARPCVSPRPRPPGHGYGGMGVLPTRLLLASLLVCLSGICLCSAQNAVGRQNVNGPEYFVDVLVVSDVPIYKAWFERTQATAQVTQREATLTALRQYFALVIQEVNKRYRTLDSVNNFRLTVRPVGFYIAETAEQSPWTVAARTGGQGRNGRGQGGRNQVDAQRSLRNLGRWVRTTPGLPRQDHVMLLSGYDLVTDDSGVLFRYTIGRATVGTVCQGGGRSVSVIEDRGAFQSVHTAAHELGHSLGAVHDGNRNGCLATDRFIMAGGTEPRTPANLRNPWFFSPCSAREIAAFVGRTLDAGLGRQCLNTALPQLNVPDVEGVMPGQVFTADQQCQHIYGAQSRYCHGGNFGTLAEICTSMFCLVPGRRRRFFCVEYHAAHGTTCGAGRWCEEGACVANLKAPNIPQGDCPFGDALTLVNRQRCPQAVAARPALCYNRRVRRICCQTCATLALTGNTNDDEGGDDDDDDDDDDNNDEGGNRSNRSNDNTNRRAGCPFGDRVRGCRRALCTTLLPDATPYAHQCCGTCDFDSQAWTCADAPGGVGGTPCRAATQVGQVQGCYNGTLAYSCCATCQQQRVPDAREGCEYGDLVPGACDGLHEHNATCTRQQTFQCCRACAASGPQGGAGRRRGAGGGGGGDGEATPSTTNGALSATAAPILTLSSSPSSLCLFLLWALLSLSVNINCFIR